MKQETKKRIAKLREYTQKFEENPKDIPLDIRQDLQVMWASVFTEFVDFAELGMRFLGFSITEQQKDIARYMQSCPNRAMVQAQRGESKSTLAALFGVWNEVQDPSYRVLIVSAGGSQASDVAKLMIGMIEHWDILCWLRADKRRGDRTSYEEYDTNSALHKLEKSASITCIGITGNLQGKRADLLIPDD